VALGTSNNKYIKIISPSPTLLIFTEKEKYYLLDYFPQKQ